jgi:hypothetical protein
MICAGVRPTPLEYLDMATKLSQRDYVEHASFGATANLFVARPVFDEVGFFRDDLVSGGDYEFGRRASLSGHKLVYASRAVVQHPARKSFRSKLSKTKRVAIGQAQLAKLGLLDHAGLGARRLIPQRALPEVPGVDVSSGVRLMAIVYANIFRYANITIRTLVRLG